MAYWSRCRFTYYTIIYHVLKVPKAKYLSFDIISSLAFGADLHMLEQPTNRSLIEALTGVNRMAGIAGQFPTMATLIVMQQMLFTKMGHYIKTITDILVAMADQRTKSKTGDTHRDIYSSVMAFKDAETGKSLDTQEMIAEMALVIIAGKDPQTN